MKSHRVVGCVALVAACIAGDSHRQTASVPLQPLASARVGASASVVRFERNAGQWDARVRFVGRGGRGTLVLTDDAMTIGANGAPVTMRLVGGRLARPRGENELPTKSNFFLGDDPSRWRTGVANFARVRASFCPGVDVVWHGGVRGLEYDLLVGARVDASSIALDVEGATGLRVRADGALEITTPRSTLVEARPAVFQGGRSLVARYRLEGAARVGFDIAGYERGRPVLIDPVVLAYSTYLGGGGADQSGAIAVDASGYVYVTGGTDSTDFPTVNAYQSSLSSGTDVFVAKLATTGAAPVYATYLGGEADDYPSGIAVDATGAVYVDGETNSITFPTKSAYQSSNGGAPDAFVTKLDASGAVLVYSTYLGGSGFDNASAIAIDASGDAFVAGVTNGSNALATAGAYQTTQGGSVDGFAAKLGASGSTLSYFTYLGGSGGDNANAVAVDGAGRAYVTGETESADFPVTVGAFQGSLAGTINAFVTKLDAAGATATYSTYLGGNGDDYGYGIAIASDGTAYVTGNTSSTNFPTANAYESTIGGSGAAFVTRLAASGSSLVFSTYLGGGSSSGGSGGRAIAIDGAGDSYVVGSTSSTDFPTLDGLQASYGGGTSDGFVTKLDPTGQALVYSTYLGGSANDFAVGIVVDSTGAAYVGGTTASTDFPTATPEQASNGGGTSDVFVSKLDPFPPFDGGVGDAGPPDASVADAGDAGDASAGDASVDASSGPDASGADAGTTPPGEPGGCGCRTAGGSGRTPGGGLLFAAAAIAVLRRRRRGLQRSAR